MSEFRDLFILSVCAATVAYVGFLMDWIPAFVVALANATA